MSQTETVGLTAPAMQTSGSIGSFWDDDTVSLTQNKTKQAIPKLPKISEDYQVVRGGGQETLAYLALQILKTEDKQVTVRAMASACSYILRDPANFTGSAKRSEEITGLEIAADETTAGTTVLSTNFTDAEDVTVDELLDLMQADTDEIGAYFGTLFLASSKRITPENRTAFNEKRAQAATASILGKAKIYVPDSPFLADEVLARVYASCLSYTPLRSHMVARVVQHLPDTHMGTSLAFMTQFLLLADTGMSALKIIKECTIKYPWVRTSFTALRPEFNAAQQAQVAIRRAPPQDRSFLKAIHGNAFVPVVYTEIENLTGVCKEIMKRTTPSYQNYGGGKITQAQLEIINNHPDISPLIEAAAVAAE